MVRSRSSVSRTDPRSHPRISLHVVRRAALRAWIVAVALSLVVPSVAGAVDVAKLRSELDDLQRETRAAGRAYDRAYWRLDEADVRIGKTDKQIAATEQELAAAQAVLGERAAGMYRSGGLDYLDVVLGAASFSEFLTRLDYAQRVGSADAEAIRRIQVLNAQLVGQRAVLEAERERRARDLRTLTKQRDRLQKRLRSLQARFKKVKAELDRARGHRLPRGIVSAPGPNGMVFPVKGSYYFSDTWGASRSGGRRRHKGTDIMAPRGTPVVAVTGGSVSSKSSRLGGKTIYLRGSNGWTFYYAHLDRYAVTSGRVSAGQVVGYVGSTGNASAGSPHLHFEIQPGGRSVNPYPYLVRMQ